MADKTGDAPTRVALPSRSPYGGCTGGRCAVAVLVYREPEVWIRSTRFFAFGRKLSVMSQSDSDLNSTSRDCDNLDSHHSSSRSSSSTMSIVAILIIYARLARFRRNRLLRCDNCYREEAVFARQSPTRGSNKGILVRLRLRGRNGR